MRNLLGWLRLGWLKIPDITLTPLTGFDDLCLRKCCGSFAENGGELRRTQLSHTKQPTSIEETCGDKESAQKQVRRQMSESWLVKSPSGTRFSIRRNKHTHILKPYISGIISK